MDWLLGGNSLGGGSGVAEASSPSPSLLDDLRGFALKTGSELIKAKLGQSPSKKKAKPKAQTTKLLDDGNGTPGGDGGNKTLMIYAAVAVVGLLLIFKK